ncbi:unnamed protein product, partial [Didymodactylos carnosus]
RSSGKRWYTRFIKREGRKSSTVFTPFKLTTGNGDNQEPERTANVYYGRVDMSYKLYFLLFVDLIVDMTDEKTNELSKQDWLREPIELFITESDKKFCLNFERTYESHQALVSYTKGTLFYPLLHKICRQKSIEWLVSYRFFISDVYKQTKKSAI